VKTIRAREAREDDVLMVRDRPVTIRTDAESLSTGTVLRYQAPDIRAGLMHCPPEHVLNAVWLAPRATALRVYPELLPSTS
jgi:hypothetical protein